MKISKKILTEMNACDSGLNRFVAAHGDKEIAFSECIKLESNSIQDYFWFIRRHLLSNAQIKDVKRFAIECAERVLPIFENEYSDDKRSRAAIETAKLYLSGKASLDDLRKSRKAAYAAFADAAGYAAYDAAYTAAYAAYDAAYAAYAADAAYDAAGADAAAYAAAYAAGADAGADAGAYAAEKSWQKQRLAEIVLSWGW